VGDQAPGLARLGLLYHLGRATCAQAEQGDHQNAAQAAHACGLGLAAHGVGWRGRAGRTRQATWEGRELENCWFLSHDEVSGFPVRVESGLSGRDDSVLTSRPGRKSRAGL
jgi:hypothetical protein